MRQGSFTREIFIKAPCQPVIELATSFEQHETLHPLIIKVEEVTAEPPALHRFWITDQIAMGPIDSR